MDKQASTVSDDAKTLLHYISNYREFGCADDSDRDFCFRAAQLWAAHIIAEGVA